MNGTYNTWLLTLSFVVAVCVSYTALNLASRVSTASQKYVNFWLGGGAIAMGTGIWSMHFIGMLAFSLPIPLGYDVTITIASLLVGIVVSGFALKIASTPGIRTKHLLVGAVVMGLGICAMHYSGMAAIMITPGITYDPTLLIASIVIAVVASFVALCLFARQRRRGGRWTSLVNRGGASLVMGVAICGMHYTGMFASRFAANSLCIGAGGSAHNGWLAATIGGLALGLLGITLILTVYDAHLERKTHQHTQALEHANEKLEHLATHDPLTGLPNRLLIEDRLEQAIAHAERNSGKFALLAMDLDRFKLINDSLGHHGGDELLRQVATRLREVKRKADTLARIGGDEFLMIVNEVNGPWDIEVIAKRIIETISQSFQVMSVEIHSSPSIGIAVYPDDGSHATELLMHADAALYHAKKCGRNTFQFFTPAMHSAVNERLQLENAMRHALANDEFELHYQPKVDVATGRVSSTEALIRWRHPQRGLVLPANFIPLAEETGLILQIGEWVLREACRQARAWQLGETGPLRVAVNLSAQQFQQRNLLGVVQSALVEAELEACFLELELTESSVMENAEQSAAILEQLSRIGVHISIDDFGTGYSSLSYLRRFPLDKLKIDRSFIKDVVTNAEDAAIVRAIVSLAHSLKLKVVAEGVETVEQLEFLRELGCDQYQGYHCSPPIAPIGFAVLMQTRLAEGNGTGQFNPLATVSRLYIPPRPSTDAA